MVRREKGAEWEYPKSQILPLESPFEKLKKLFKVKTMKTTKPVVYSFNETIDIASGNLIITGITSSLGIEYVQIEKCKPLLGKAPKTARREIDKIKTSNGIPKKFRSRVIMVQGKYFVSRFLIERKTKKKETRKKGQKLFDGYVTMLGKYDWKLAGSLRSKHNINFESNRRYMIELNEFLIRVFANNFTLFYVIEPNDPLFSQKNDPHHVHYLIGFDSTENIEPVINKIELHYAIREVVYKNTSWLQKYNPNLDYLKYCAAKINARKDNYFLFRESDILLEK